MPLPIQTTIVLGGGSAGFLAACAEQSFSADASERGSLAEYSDHRRW